MSRKNLTPARGGGESHRVQRVEREIREVIGTYLIRGFRGELPGTVSVSRVIASKDLKTAKVFVTLMTKDSVVTEPSATAKKAAIKELQAHAHEIQAEVNRRLQMKHCPRLGFFYDEGLGHALKVESILRDIEKSRRPAEE